AQTVIKADQFNLEGAKTIDGYTVELKKNNGATKPALNGDAIRLYAEGSLTVSGEKITKIVVTLASSTSKRYTTFTPNVGELSPAQAAGDTEITWVGDAKSVEFTVGAKADFGTDGNSKAGQVHFTEITIYGEGGSGVEPDPTPDPTPDPDPITTVGDGSETNPYTVTDVIALNNTKNVAAWVKGYIVGSSNGGASLTLTPADEEQSVSNILIAATADETNIDAIIAVQLPSKSEIRTALNLKDNPGNLGKVVEINGTLSAYFGSHPGVKSPTAYKLDGQGVDPTPDPDPVTTEGEGTQEKPYTVADVIALDNTKADAAWVTGYIVGAMNTSDSKNYVFETVAPFTVASNLYIAATADETDQTKMLPVQLVSGGKVRADLNLQDRPGNLGKEVSIKGKLEKYFGQPGIKEPSEYTIVGGLAPLPVAETPSLTSFVEEQSESNMKITGAVTVFYQSPDKKYTFITDGETNLEVYGALPEYHNGDQLTGIIGKYGFYQNMPQMTPQADSFGAATAGTPVEPKNVAFNQVGICDYVVIDAIEIT
ncbi:MAG: hypothetical protein K2N10_05400, partial [Muribaculaceae bacterium]|nr:hypothetical protein [Muribaculaceae bacterium]